MVAVEIISGGFMYRTIIRYQASVLSAVCKARFQLLLLHTAQSVDKINLISSEARYEKYYAYKTCRHIHMPLL